MVVVVVVVVVVRVRVARVIVVVVVVTVTVGDPHCRSKVGGRASGSVGVAGQFSAS